MDYYTMKRHVTRRIRDFLKEYEDDPTKGLTKTEWEAFKREIMLEHGLGPLAIQRSLQVLDLAHLEKRLQNGGVHEKDTLHRDDEKQDAP